MKLKLFLFRGCNPEKVVKHFNSVSTTECSFLNVLFAFFSFPTSFLFPFHDLTWFSTTIKSRG
jgi:hypothetical protein